MITSTRDVRRAPLFHVLAGGVLILGCVACADEDDGGEGGNTAQNACQNGGAGCSSSALDQSGSPNSGTGSLRVVFGSESVDGSSDRAAVSETDGEGYISISASTLDNTFSCSTTQTGDEFTDVRCAAYSMGQYIQGTIGEFLCFNFVQGSTGAEAPVTIRVDLGAEDAFVMETAWGFCSCEGGNGGQTCDGTTVGDGSRDACCTIDDECESGRCCTSDEPCFGDADDRYTCRDPLS